MVAYELTHVDNYVTRAYVRIESRGGVSSAEQDPHGGARQGELVGERVRKR